MAHAHLYEHNDFRGRQLVVDNPDNDRYSLAPFDYLNAFSFNDLTSSVRLHSGTQQIPSMCIVFENTRFDGNFQGFAYNGNRDINALPGFNDTTSCVLLIDHDPNPRKSVLNLKSLGGDKINQAIDDQLKDVSEASRRGDVGLKFIIDLYEISLYGTDLALIDIPITVHTPSPFSNYDASIKYYVNFYIDSMNRLRGYIAGYGYWIEGGILTGSIESRLGPQVAAKIGDVETALNNMLLEVNWHKWTDVYLAPGYLLDVTSDYSGNINDDVSLILPYYDDIG